VGNRGVGDISSPTYGESEGKFMYTITNILQDVQRGITAHNMVETEFSYRIIYFINFENGSAKHYIDTRYDDLRITLESVIRENLTTTNNIVLATVTTRRNGEIVSLLSRSYPFSLDGYFLEICGEKRERVNGNYGRRRAQWC